MTVSMFHLTSPRRLEQVQSPFPIYFFEGAQIRCHDLAQVRLGPKTAENDLQMKLRQVSWDRSPTATSLNVLLTSLGQRPMLMVMGG